MRKAILMGLPTVNCLKQIISSLSAEIVAMVIVQYYRRSCKLQLTNQTHLISKINRIRTKNSICRRKETKGIL